MVNRFVGTSMNPGLHSDGIPRWLSFVLAIPLFLSSSGDAQSVEGSLSDRSRWEPSLSITLTLATNVQSGAGVSTVDDPLIGSTLTLSPGFGAAVGLTSPEIAMLPLKPRFFVSGAIIPTLAFKRDVAKSGDPRGFVLPIQEENGQGYPENAIDGQGSLVAGQIQVLNWSVDVGLEVSHQYNEHVLYLRPSFSWTRFAVDTEGRVLRAFKPNYDPEPGYPRLVTLTDLSSRPFDAFGGGIEMGVDMGRRGSLRPSVFLSTSFYSVTGDRSIGMSDTFTDSFGTESARWVYSVDPFLFRLQLGLRVAWLGKAM
jgi:hypothetical protein